MKYPIPRRKFIVACLGTVSLAGCNGRGSDDDGPPGSELRIIADSYRQNGQWYADLNIMHYQPREADFHNVTVIGYSKTGTPVCRIELGNSSYPGNLEAFETVECDAFPYLFAVTADEGPCKEGVFLEVCRWNGPDEYRRKKDPKGEVVDYYETFERRCGEELPPERLLPDDPETTTDASADS
jgi:hypothetical protein